MNYATSYKESEEDTLYKIILTTSTLPSIQLFPLV